LQEPLLASEYCACRTDEGGFASASLCKRIVRNGGKRVCGCGSVWGEREKLKTEMLKGCGGGMLGTEKEKKLK
jgi:hypothetical protein